MMKGSMSGEWGRHKERIHVLVCTMNMIENVQIPFRFTVHVVYIHR
jgi:hypothetical protein